MIQPRFVICNWSMKSPTLYDKKSRVIMMIEKDISVRTVGVFVGSIFKCVEFIDWMYNIGMFRINTFDSSYLILAAAS